MAKLIIQIKKGFVLVEINETMERKNVFNDKIIFVEFSSDNSMWNFNLSKSNLAFKYHTHFQVLISL